MQRGPPVCSRLINICTGSKKHLQAGRRAIFCSYTQGGIVALIHHFDIRTRRYQPTQQLNVSLFCGRNQPGRII